MSTRLALVPKGQPAAGAAPDAETELINAAERINTMLRGLVVAYKHFETLARTDRLKAHCLERQSQLLGFQIQNLTYETQKELDERARQLRSA